MTESLDAAMHKDMRGLGKPPSFDGKDAEYQDFRISFRIHNSLSTVDGQVRSRVESDLPGSSEIAGRCTPEVLHTDVVLVGFDNERQCPTSCPISRGSRGMASDTQQICARHSEADSAL